MFLNQLIFCNTLYIYIDTYLDYIPIISALYCLDVTFCMQFLKTPYWSTTSADLYPLTHNFQAFMALPVKNVKAFYWTHLRPTVCPLQDQDDRGLYNDWRGNAVVPAYPLNDRKKSIVSERVTLPPSGHTQQDSSMLVTSFHYFK